LWWIILLSWLLVESGVVLAQSLWIPEVVIWLTILAAWTSVPDLISSIIVAKQWRGDMAVTNALGSNIFDICFCLWFPRFIYALINGSVPISTAWLWTSVSLLFGILILVFWTFMLTKFRINKYVWWFFISVYLAYLCWMIWSALFAA
jgi:Ca2+/Na+ antiporter